MNKSILAKVKRKGALLALCGIFSLVGITESAIAACVTGDSDPASFSLLIDASSSCDNIDNMYGCEIDASGSCTITNPNTGETILVSLTNGTVGGTIPISWSSSSPNGSLADFVILIGATAGGTCGFNYVPGSDFGNGLIFEKSNGSNQKVNGVSVCSDFSEPPPSEPRLILEKTVTRTVTADPVADCATAQDLIDVNVNDEVRYCYTIENVGAGLAESVTLQDDEGTPGSTINVTLSGLNNDGSLNSGATATGSRLATLLEAGSLFSTATATASGLGGTIIVTATDSVTVSAIAESCPTDYQNVVNQLSQSTGLDFAFLQDPNLSGRRSLCVPNGANGSPDTRRYACIDQCITRPECEDPNNPLCIGPSVCEPSGSWSTKRTGTDVITGYGTYECTALPRPIQATNPAPYCWEIQQDLGADCGIPDELEPQEETTLNIKKLHVNPYVWQTCYSSGGRYVCETMCYIFAGEDATACPLNSTIVN
jgi:hypothetical protein